MQSSEDNNKFVEEISTTTANKAIRHEDADEQEYRYEYDKDGTRKKEILVNTRYAVELVYEDPITGDVDYGLDWEYFDTEEEAFCFINNTKLVPCKQL